MNIKTVLLCVCGVLCSQIGLALGDPSPEVVSKSPSNIPAEYQAAISKAYSGYQILSPSEILLNKKEMGAKLYNKVKGSPGLIVGKFNDDNIEDFAALIRNSTKKTDIVTMEGKVIARNDFYGGVLAICFGLGEGKFDCTKIPGEFSEVHIPTDFALNKTDQGKYLCTNLMKLDPTKDREPYDSDYGEKHNIPITAHTDIIGYFRTGQAWAGIKYIYQSKNAILRCVESSD